MSGRGELVISRKVVEKIAQQAAKEVATGGGSGVIGIRSHTALSAPPGADAGASGQSAWIELDISVAYPAPLRQTTEQVRQHVMDRVAELVGLDVSRVDITITALHSAAARPKVLQ